eukprot:1553280-Prymnesium_polylepis.1
MAAVRACALVLVHLALRGVDPILVEACALEASVHVRRPAEDALWREGRRELAQHLVAGGRREVEPHVQEVARRECELHLGGD